MNQLNWRKKYRAKPSICNACELKARCTTSERGRVVYRPFEEDFYDRVRGYRGKHPYEKALRKRKVWVEPLFAEAKGPTRTKTLPAKRRLPESSAPSRARTNLVAVP